MLVFVFAVPLLAAILCLALNRAVPTRWLGMGAAGACASTGILLLIGQYQGALALTDHAWAVLDAETIWLTLRLDAFTWPFAMLVMVGGALALLGLAVSLPITLRGFGGLFAALLLVLLLTLIGLALQETLLLPFAWALIALLSFAARRASGVQYPDQPLPSGLIAGLLSALVLLGAVLALQATEPGVPPGPMILAGWIIAGLLAFGAPLFHQAFAEQADAPAGVTAPLLALGLPLLAGVALTRFIIDRAVLSQEVRVVLILIGLLTLIACTSGALGEQRMRRLIGWQFSAQLGLLFIAFAQDEQILSIVAPALLINAVVSTLAGYLAVALIERRTSTDNLAEIGELMPLIWPGLALFVAGASAVGLPGAWGFWARLWLFDSLLPTTPWVAPALLAASTLLALTYLAPLSAFWRLGPEPKPERVLFEQAWPAKVARASPVVAALPLLALGVAPQLGYRLITGGQDPAPMIALPGIIAQIALASVVTLLMALPYILRRWSARQISHDPDTQLSGPLPPQAIGEILRPVAWIGAPGTLLSAVWGGLLWGSQMLSRVLALFEQRYYLAGFVIALVVVILLLL